VEGERLPVLIPQPEGHRRAIQGDTIRPESIRDILLDLREHLIDVEHAG
jgi:hypothetical protein